MKRGAFCRVGLGISCTESSYMLLAKKLDMVLEQQKSPDSQFHKVDNIQILAIVFISRSSIERLCA